MPKKAKSNAPRRTTRKSAYSQYRANRRSLNRNLSTSMSPFNRFTQNMPNSNHRVVQMSYAENFALASGVAGVTGTPQQMRLNSIFDPNLTGGGHQPYGRDELANEWLRYKVFRVDVEVEFSAPTGGSAYGVVAIQNTADTFSFNGVSTQSCMEKPNTWVKHIKDDETETVCRFSKPLHEIIGVTWDMFKSDQTSYGALMSGNAPTSPVLTIAVCDAGGTQDTTSRVLVRLVYHTYLWGRITLAFS